MPQDYTTPVPQSLRPAIAITRDRKSVSQIAPQIDGMMSAASEQLTQILGREIPASGYTVACDSILEAIKESFSKNSIDKTKVCPYTIVLELPACFEGAIATMAVQKPFGFNWPNTSLREADTYFAWKCCLPLQSEGNSAFRTMEAWVKEVEFRDIARWTIWNSDEESSWCWQPIVFLAGRQVAVGGFAVDEAFLCGLQGANAAVYSYPPVDYYSQEELARAADEELRVGPHPWYDGILTMEHAEVLGVHVLQCNTRPN